MTAICVCRAELRHEPSADARPRKGAWELLLPQRGATDVPSKLYAGLPAAAAGGQSNANSRVTSKRRTVSAYKTELA